MGGRYGRGWMRCTGGGGGKEDYSSLITTTATTPAGMGGVLDQRARQSFSEPDFPSD
jgi:hypothetical protein